MSYNPNYVNYKTPNSAGYAYTNNYADSTQPVYTQPGQLQNGYNSTTAGQRPQVTQPYGQQYTQYPPNAYQNSYMAPGGHQQTPRPPVPMEQRSPGEYLASPTTSTPQQTFHQNIFQRSPPPPSQHPQLPPPQPTWQNGQQPQRPRPSAQYNAYSPAQYSSQSVPMPSFQPAPHQRPTKSEAMVEIPLASPRYPQNPPPPQRSHHIVSQSNSTTASPRPANAPNVKKATPRTLPPVDYQQLLVLLAEDYINAAHGMGSVVAFHRREEDLKEYYNLMATGLGCIEASLREFRLLPQMEASLTLQYANLLFHETDNYDEVERWLSKAIPLCDRNKLLDLKYSMHHLSARTLFLSKPRVALKSLDALIPNVQAYRHVPWIYAFRFLRVSFSMKLGATHQDLASAIQHLRAISELSSSENDAAVTVTCATFEALLHLRLTSPSCVEEAQRAIASARSFQFHAMAKELTQIWALLDCIELVCSLMQCNSETASAKAAAIAPLMDKLSNASKTNDDGILMIPIQATPSSLTNNTSGIFRRVNGKDYLTFTWLHKRDLYVLCFLLSSIAVQAKNHADPKAETYLREGLKIMKENFSESSLSREDIVLQSTSLSSAVQRLDWWHNIRWYFHIYLTISASNRVNWAAAQEHLNEAMTCPRVSSVNSAASRSKWETFLQGTIFQATGQIDKALQTFQSPILQLPQTSTQRLYDAETDLCILAVLNSILIILDPSHPQSQNAPFLHASVSSIIASHPNVSLHAAHDLLHSVLNPHDKLIDKKKHLTKCITAARHVMNHQLVAIALSLMCTMFFKDVMGDQAQKSAKTARALAERSGNTLWKGVTAGLVENTAMRHGNGGDAEFAAEETERFVGTLSEGIRDKFRQV